VWEIFTAATSQFAYDFHVSPLEVMEALGVPQRWRAKLLRRVAQVYDIARKNQERTQKAGIK